LNHKEALTQLNDKQLNSILNKLQIEPFKGASKQWIAKEITAFYQDTKKFRRLIPSLGEKTINDLILFSHIQKPFNYEQVQLLNDYGILVKGELPYDLKDRIIEWSRSMFVKTFSMKSEEAQHSFFLNCVLLLYFFEREINMKLTRRKNDRNVRRLAEELIMYKETVWKALNALVLSGLVLKTKDLYELNTSVFIKWKKEPIDTVLESFYREQAGNRVILFLGKISEYQQKPEEWVDMTVISNTSIEFDRSRQLGLIQVHKNSGKTYIQLMPEGWYLTKKQIHPLWSQEPILVSASFEIFVPFLYDPFVLFELLPVCRMKDSNYFLVFDIELGQVKNKKVLREFYHTLVGNSSVIPDVVNYELQAAINN
jgi:predicted transcriptional regulator